MASEASIAQSRPWHPNPAPHGERVLNSSRSAETSMHCQQRERDIAPRGMRSLRPWALVISPKKLWNHLLRINAFASAHWPNALTQSFFSSHWVSALAQYPQHRIIGTWREAAQRSIGIAQRSKAPLLKGGLGGIALNPKRKILWAVGVGKQICGVLPPTSLVRGAPSRIRRV